MEIIVKITAGPIFTVTPDNTVAADTTELTIETPSGPIGPYPLVPAITDGVEIDLVLQPIPGTGTGSTPDTPGTQNVRYRWASAAGISDALSTVVITPSTIVATDDVATFTITVTLKSYANTAIVGDTVVLTSGTGVNITPASGVSNGSGQVVFTATSLVAQTATFTAEDTTQEVVLAQTPTGIFGMNSDSSSFESDEVQRVGTADTLVVTLYDGDLNPVPNHLITITADPSGPTFTPLSATTDVNGQVTIQANGNAEGITTYTAYDNTQALAVTTQPETDFMVPVPLDGDFIVDTSTGWYAVLWDGTATQFSAVSTYPIAANYDETWYFYRYVTAPYSVTPTDSVSPQRALASLSLPWQPSNIIDAPDLTNLLMWKADAGANTTPYLFNVTTGVTTQQAATALTMEEPVNPVRTGDYVFWYKGNSNNQVLYRQTISSGLIVEFDLTTIIPGFVDDMRGFTANATHVIIYIPGEIVLLDLSGNCVSTTVCGDSIGLIFNCTAVANATYLFLQNNQGEGDGAAIVTLADGTLLDVTLDVGTAIASNPTPKLTAKNF